ncbi:hypothetical protein BFW01_g2804 [Lasiodiplodia theobromae]|nr:hypothetical protein BFW01_g2804 [Lasiodiplodia theobromae]
MPPLPALGIMTTRITTQVASTPASAPSGKLAGLQKAYYASSLSCWMRTYSNRYCRHRTGYDAVLRGRFLRLYDIMVFATVQFSFTGRENGVLISTAAASTCVYLFIMH